MLNFSGGFDSLAAYLLLPSNTHLISGDFLGGFKRESMFFNEFSPHVYRTNFRSAGYNNNSWSFMGAGACLYKSHLNASSLSFGTVLEANFAYIRRRFNSLTPARLGPFDALGLRNLQLTHALTEVGTMMIVSHFAPELVQPSLMSCANPNSEKMVRKQTLLELVTARYGTGVSIKIDECKRKQMFGQTFATTFLSLWLLKRGGREAAERTINAIPSEAVDFISDKQLTFYERYNPRMLAGLDSAQKTYFQQRLSEAGVLPYDETDFEELKSVAEFLGSSLQKYKTRNNETTVIRQLQERIAKLELQTTSFAQGVIDLPMITRLTWGDPETVAVDIKPSEAKYNYARVFDLPPGGRYMIDFELVSGSSHTCTVLLYDPIMKTKSHRIKVSQGEPAQMCFQIADGFGKLQLIAYPHEIGKTTGHSLSAKATLRRAL